MSALYFVGIDPGLVHTGAVSMALDPQAKGISIAYRVIEGNYQALQAQSFCELVAAAAGSVRPTIYVETYRERGTGYNTNQKMRELLVELKTKLPRHAEFLDNMGVKKVVRQPLLNAFGLTGFPTTHHKDLESAARIMLLGMLKNEQSNLLLATALNDMLEGQSWSIYGPHAK